ncbi:MAG: serine/threonine-protein kinase [Gallionella sp.]|nr:serine/threonine-protein kinase [Gallionella sp.]
MISQLGRYEIISELGQGAMGVVYKAKDPLIDREVAVKTINLSLAQEEREEYEARFYQEAKAAGRLSHPNIVTIYDVGRSEDIAYIAMEYLHGRELRDILNDNKILPIVQVIDIIAQVALGLSYAHEHDIVHRDIKPSNVMVIRDGHVKITDFGIARMASAAVRTQTGMVLGSPKYMSPEQVMGKLTDQRSDIFSLGVMLYEMLTGQAPFLGENVNSIMYQTLNTTPATPSSLNPDVPEMLNFIVAKALAKDLDSRYQNARDLANDLRACRDALPRTSAVNPLPDTTPKAFNATNQDATPSDLADAGEESNQVPTLGLSTSFDSMEATMRLASMTASEEDVEELSKTFRMSRPSMDDINRAGIGLRADAASKAAPVSRSYSQPTPPANGGGYILLAIIALVVIGLISTIVF